MLYVHVHDEAEFKETQHPRTKGGEFAPKGAGGGGAAGPDKAELKKKQMKLRKQIRLLKKKLNLSPEESKHLIGLLHELKAAHSSAGSKPKLAEVKHIPITVPKKSYLEKLITSVPVGSKNPTPAPQPASTVHPPDEVHTFNALSSVMSSGAAESYMEAAKAKGPSVGLKPSEAAWVIAYSYSAYAPLNKALRHGAKTQAQHDYAVGLNAALDKLPPHKGTTYRGSTVPSNIAALYQPGMIVEERGFTSTTTDPNMKFGGDFKFEVRSKTGRSIKALSNSPHEQEVLFKSGTHFRIVSNSGGKIVMEEV